MNPLTTTADIPEALKKLARADGSLRVRTLMDIWSGRHCCECHSMYFHANEDAFGNSYVDADCFSVQGVIAFEVRMWKHFWARVRVGELGLSFKRLFEPAAQQQTVQTQAASSEQHSPSVSESVQTN